MKNLFRKIISVARSQGWQEGLYETLRSGLVKDYASFGEERGGDVRFFLPITPDSQVLQIGAEWGYSAAALAKTCKNIYVGDFDREKLEFLEIRKNEDGISNLTCVHIRSEGMVELPSILHSFDVIVVREYGREMLQGRILEKLWKYLKPGGILYVALERRVPHATFLWVIRRLFSQSRFPRVEFFAVIPHHSLPLFFLPIEHRPAMSFFFKNLFGLFATVPPERGKRYRIVYLLARTAIRAFPLSMLVFFIKVFWPSFGVIATKEK